MTTEQRLSLAERFLAERRYAASLRLVDPLTARAPRTKEDLAAHRLLAHAAYGVGRMAAAERAARRVLTRRPKDAAMMRILVRALQRQGRHHEAALWMTRLDELGTDTWDDPAA
jgi:Flp pilus assembly protein TadD